MHKTQAQKQYKQKGELCSSFWETIFTWCATVDVGSRKMLTRKRKTRMKGKSVSRDISNTGSNKLSEHELLDSENDYDFSAQKITMLRHMCHYERGVSYCLILFDMRQKHAKALTKELRADPRGFKLYCLFSFYFCIFLFFLFFCLCFFVGT